MYGWGPNYMYCSQLQLYSWTLFLPYVQSWWFYSIFFDLLTVISVTLWSSYFYMISSPDGRLVVLIRYDKSDWNIYTRFFIIFLQTFWIWYFYTMKPQLLRFFNSELGAIVSVKYELLVVILKKCPVLPKLVSLNKNSK